jgi:hypothetical protein
MKKMLYSVTLTDGQTIPFLFADLEQKYKIEKFKDFFETYHEDREQSYHYSRLTYNGSNVELNLINSKYPYIREFGLEIKPEDVVSIQAHETSINGRYYLFAGAEYYPAGGFHDLVFVDDNLSVLKNILKNGLYAAKVSVNWSHIVDIQTGEMIIVDKENIGLEGGVFGYVGY